MVPSNNIAALPPLPPRRVVGLLLLHPSFSCTHSLATVAVVSASTDCSFLLHHPPVPVPGLSGRPASLLLLQIFVACWLLLLLSIHRTAPHRTFHCSSSPNTQTLLRSSAAGSCCITLQIDPASRRSSLSLDPIWPRSAKLAADPALTVAALATLPRLSPAGKNAGGMRGKELEEAAAARVSARVCKAGRGSSSSSTTSYTS